ncbi:hypothetical protein AMTR_s00186p00028360 [Amborella trichopoda]|uniref:Uncharacterized protein n=1 Tax=Amborella trichopoda TaxID=13333 RepID=W1PAW8_AMBTC|nr:hypothetical protein AMTR_s00186p00028360 [Amborella trichopoda]
MAAGFGAKRILLRDRGLLAMSSRMREQRFKDVLFILGMNEDDERSHGQSAKGPPMNGDEFFPTTFCPSWQSETASPEKGLSR